jgi:hypothetical protein
MNKNIRGLYRGIIESVKCYQHRTNLVKGENCGLLALPLYLEWAEELFLSVVECRWDGLRQTEVQITEPLVPEPGSFEV